MHSAKALFNSCLLNMSAATTGRIYIHVFTGTVGVYKKNHKETLKSWRDLHSGLIEFNVKKQKNSNQTCTRENQQAKWNNQ